MTVSLPLMNESSYHLRVFIFTIVFTSNAIPRIMCHQLSLVKVLLNLVVSLIYLEVSIFGGFSKFGGNSTKFGDFDNLSRGFYSWRFH
jgi:hypothetical protein